jgi:alpha-amylase/alpha-mannosidase (GH57 family)
MASSDKTQSETETILMALDQISQTIDVMTSVVGRLRNYMQQQEAAAAAADQSKGLQAEMRGDRILH